MQLKVTDREGNVEIVEWQPKKWSPAEILALPDFSDDDATTVLFDDVERPNFTWDDSVKKAARKQQRRDNTRQAIIDVFAAKERVKRAAERVIKTQILELLTEKVEGMTMAAIYREFPGHPWSKIKKILLEMATEGAIVRRDRNKREHRYVVVEGKISNAV